uniref:Uncharacterized protein n=1 Tax=Craspedostauros australis TaxID=1486917 RepID=A0A6T6HCD4_9STRA|eukprot:CAMPEP_0198116510 /NCGR_PEP_ID=MMETSP1442-20131203/13002_1 /TAXON_ID= /ORGANISM="Craspedostauros australis, Strain CCMP3328" /LENGTH=295 /DNA_ID=CAMNT_0043774351 /DNA_START=36 /DNA_END=923 /DNA_ORIENTATION=+
MSISKPSSQTAFALAAALAIVSTFHVQGFTIPSPVPSRPAQQHCPRATALAAAASAEEQVAPKPTSKADPHWMDFLKYDGQPTFDVIEKTKQYTSEPGYKSFNLAQIPTTYYDDEYLFRGPFIGPMTREDLDETNSNFKVSKVFPDLDRVPFGFAVDPENPYRVLYFERWEYTHTGDFELINTPITLLPTNNYGKQPLVPFSLNWTPEGKIIYAALGGEVDRFEGNTQGKSAVTGLMQTMGLMDGIHVHVGNKLLCLFQKFVRFANQPLQQLSKEEDIPSWWKSKARGAEVNDTV